ncbi:MAG: beta-ketoacyl synthase N-terminal-like domain-containing protein [Candidatus Binatia bacterium]
MTQTKVAVTGFGLISSLGRGAEKNLAALRAGSSGIVSRRPEWADQKMRSQISGNVEVQSLRALFDHKQNRFLSDGALLGAAAMMDAIVHAGLSQDQVEDPKTGIVMGTGSGASIPDAVALGERLKKRGGSKVGAYHVPLIMGSSITANLGSLFHIHGHSYSVTSACSTSAHALMTGLDLIRSGRQERVFAGGAEDINIFSASAFDGMNALSSAYNDEPTRASRPLDKARDGFVFSGGSAVLVLENLKIAESRGAKVWAVLQGAAATCDGDDMVVPSQIGAEAAMQLALQDAAIPAEKIDYLNLHGTSTPVGDIKEVKAILSVFGSKVPRFSSTKSMTGHGLGAAGAQEAIFCILMMQHGLLAPNINLEDPDPLVADLPVVRVVEKTELTWTLSNSLGFGGTNCSLILSHPDRSL